MWIPLRFRDQQETKFQILKVVDRLGERFKFFIPLGIQTEKHLNYIITRIIQVFQSFRLQLHDAIYRPDSFVLVLRYCVNLKAIRYESTSLNRIVADKSYRGIVAL